MARRWLFLVFLVLLAAPAAAQTVEIAPGTKAVLNDAEVYLDLFQSERTYFAVHPDAVQLDDQNLSVDSPSQVRMTLEKLQPEVPEGEDAVRFTANASSTPDTRFTITGLRQGTYRVVKDGSNLTTVETDADGTITFNHSAWTGDHLFEVISEPPERLSLGTDRLDLGLGQELTTTVTVYNPRSDTETVELSVEPNMQPGSVYPRLMVEGEREERVTFDLGPQAQRTVELVVEGTSCPDSCDGTVDIRLDTLATGQSYFESMTVTVQRETEVHGSPGITLIQLVVVALLGGLVVLRRS